MIIKNCSSFCVKKSHDRGNFGAGRVWKCLEVLKKWSMVIDALIKDSDTTSAEKNYGIDFVPMKFYQSIFLFVSCKYLTSAFCCVRISCLETPT